MGKKNQLLHNKLVELILISYSLRPIIDDLLALSTGIKE
jgi:hypothetical protein